MVWYGMAFKPASSSSVESYHSLFSPLVWFVWLGVDAPVRLGCAPKADRLV